MLLLCEYKCKRIFFFNDSVAPEIFSLSLHDALPISHFALGHTDGHRIVRRDDEPRVDLGGVISNERFPRLVRDRKSTRLNSSYQIISYAVFCLKKKKKD